jgi:hypothetical protein
MEYCNCEKVNTTAKMASSTYAIFSTIGGTFLLHVSPTTTAAGTIATHVGILPITSRYTTLILNTNDTKIKNDAIAREVRVEK